MSAPPHPIHSLDHPNSHPLDCTIAVLGDQGVGKTSILDRYLLNSFNAQPIPTKDILHRDPKTLDMKDV